MKKIVLLFIIHCSFLIAVCFSQSITWQSIFNNYYSYAVKSQQTSDGGYITAANARISGYYKIYLIKQNAYGDTLFTRLIGGSGGSNNCRWVEQTNDGGYILGGVTDAFGIYNEAAYLVKTDSLGNIQWQKLYGDQDVAQIYCVKQTSDGGYVMALAWSTNPYSSIMVMKTDSIGTVQWQKIFGNNPMLTFTPCEVQIVGKNGYVAVGNSSIPYVYTGAIILLRMNLNGDTLWTKFIGANYRNRASSIDNTLDGGLIICGATDSLTNGQRFQSYVVKMDSLGNIQWSRFYSSFGDDGADAIRKNLNSGYVIVGNSDSLNHNVYKAKIRLIDLMGNVLLETSYLPTVLGGSATFLSVEVTNDTGFIISGWGDNNLGVSFIYIVKTDSLGFAKPIGIKRNGNRLPTQFQLFQNYPNPFNPTTKIKFSLPHPSKGGAQAVKLVVFDILGREVASLIPPLWGGQEGLKPGTYEVEFDGSNYASGIYFYSLIAGDFIQTKKMVLLK